MASCNNDYASKGLANGVGIPALVLGSLGFLQSGGLGGLGGILGGGGRGIAAGAEMQYVSQLQAENAGLKAEQRGDEKNTALYSQTLRDNRNLRDELFSFIKPLSDEAANNRVEIATLKAEVKCNAEKADLREQIVLGKINEMGIASKGRFDLIDQTIAGLAGTVHNITKTVIPNEASCPGWGPVCTQPIPCPSGK